MQNIFNAHAVINSIFKKCEICLSLSAYHAKGKFWGMLLGLSENQKWKIICGMSHLVVILKTVWMPQSEPEIIRWKNNPRLKERMLVFKSKIFFKWHENKKTLRINLYLKVILSCDFYWKQIENFFWFLILCF